jgi:hypothetical protein
LSAAKIFLEEVVLVEDQPVIADLNWLLQTEKLLCEPAAACVLTAAERLAPSLPKDCVIGLVLCGSNVSLEDLDVWRREYWDSWGRQRSAIWRARDGLVRRDNLTINPRPPSAKSILLVVYFAFGEAVVGGLWHQLAGRDLVFLLILNCMLLAAVLVITTLVSRLFGFSRPDEIAIVFCGSKKSLGSGVPIASIFFPAATVGIVILPIMLFHQIQLMVCAVLARSYASRRDQAQSARKR